MCQQWSGATKCLLFVSVVLIGLQAPRKGNRQVEGKHNPTTNHILSNPVVHSRNISPRTWNKRLEQDMRRYTQSVRHSNTVPTCWARIFEWHAPAVSGNKLQEIKVAGSHLFITWVNSQPRPNYVLAPYYPFGDGDRMGGISFARSKLFYTTVTMSLNTNVIFSLVYEIPVQGCWTCGQNMQITSDLEKWHGQLSELSQAQVDR